jgi:hypothetical protein
MNQVKKLLVAAVAATALLALVGTGTAAATAVYKGATKMGVGEKIDFSLKKETSGNFTETSGGTLDTCTGTTIKLSISQAGSSTTTTTGNVTELINTGCTFPTTAVILGKGEIHHISGTTNGILTADAEIGVTINTVFFGTCIYGVTAGTTLGTLTGGTPATFHANSVMKKLSGSAFACPETGKWTGTYVSTEPAGDLHVEAS